MKTVTDNLKEMADEIQHLLKDLLLNHSEIYMWNKPGGGVAVISTRGDHAYSDLKEAGRQVQAKLLEEYRRFYELLSVLFKGQPKDTRKELADSHTVLLRTIEQNHTWCETPQEALDKAAQALQKQLTLLNRLYDPSSGEAVFVPDTNALLYNPDLKSWTFSNIPRFTIVLTPTVLSELDSLKVNHRNEEVRKKAEKLIRQIKEFRRRGRLTSGVPVVRDRIQAQSIAVEPNIEASLPWLDANNNDDRILASVIEVMRTRPRSVVVAVSRDLNFQNKAEFANIPFVEPPDSISQ